MAEQNPTQKENARQAAEQARELAESSRASAEAARSEADGFRIRLEAQERILKDVKAALARIAGAEQRRPG